VPACTTAAPPVEPATELLAAGSGLVLQAGKTRTAQVDAAKNQRARSDRFIWPWVDAATPGDQIFLENMDPNPGSDGGVFG
jgi:hypothetical protein